MSGVGLETFLFLNSFVVLGRRGKERKAERMGRRLSALKLNRRCRCVGEREKQAMGVVSGPRAAFGISGALGLSREPQSGLGNIPPPFCFVLFCFHFCWATLEGSLRSLTPPRFFPPCVSHPFPTGASHFFWGWVGSVSVFRWEERKKSYWVYFGVLCFFFLLTTNLRC